MNHEEIISHTTKFVKSTLSDAEGGHDWWHIHRVWKLSKTIAVKENVNLLVVELGALLHDIADSKFHGGDEEIGPKISRDYLESININKETIDHVTNIIRHISYSKSLEFKTFNTHELRIVQDADRLDAIGAIGIARAFNYGGHKGRAIYDPEIKPDTNMTKEEYKNSQAPTINHFYEKLLKLKDLMNTETGHLIAQHRHDFMLNFLNEFYAECEGKL